MLAPAARRPRYGLHRFECGTMAARGPFDAEDVERTVGVR